MVCAHELYRILQLYNIYIYFSLRYRVRDRDHGGEHGTLAWSHHFRPAKFLGVIRVI